MDREQWSSILEESRMVNEELQLRVSALSDFRERASERLDEHAKIVNKSAVRVDESRRLLESVRELQERLAGLMCKSSELGELASSELILAHRTNGKHSHKTFTRLP